MSLFPFPSVVLFVPMSSPHVAPKFEDAQKLAITVDLIPVLSSVLTQLAARNDHVRFHGLLIAYVLTLLFVASV